MEKPSLIGNRLVVSVVVFLTVILLFGSLLLQRIIFKADQANAALYLLPQSSAVLPGDTVSFAVNANLASPLVVGGGQFVFSYNPAELEFIDVTPATFWQTVKQKSDQTDTAGSLAWALLPSPEKGKTLELNGSVTFGSLNFKAKKGQAVVALDSRQSSLVGVNAPGAGLYNAITSVQNGVVSVTESLANNTSQERVVNTEQKVSTPGTNQRIVSSEAIVLPNSAVLLVGLKYQGNVSVRFGPDKNLINTVESTQLSSEQVLRLAALKPATLYYYQLTTTNSDRTSKWSSQIQSFTTPLASQAPVSSDKSISRVLPASTKNTSTVFVALYDEQGNLTKAVPDIKIVSGQASLTAPVAIDGLYQVTVVSLAPSKQEVQVAVGVGSQILATQKITFDQNFAEPKEPTKLEAHPLAWSTPTKLAVAILGLVVAGLIAVFIYLSRVK